MRTKELPLGIPPGRALTSRLLGSGAPPELRCAQIRSAQAGQTRPALWPHEGCKRPGSPTTTASMPAEVPGETAHALATSPPGPKCPGPRTEVWLRYRGYEQALLATLCRGGLPVGHRSEEQPSA